MLSQLVRKWSLLHPDKIFLSGNKGEMYSYSKSILMIEKLSKQIKQCYNLKQQQTAVILTSNGNIGCKLFLWQVAVLDSGVNIAYIDSQSIPSRRITAMSEAIASSITWSSDEIVTQYNQCDSLCESDDFLCDHNVEQVSCGNLIFHTSGTTGFPKQVHTSASKLLDYAASRCEDEDINIHSRILLASSSMFDPAQGDFFSVLHSGCTLCVPDYSEYVIEPAKVVLTHRPTNIVSTPTIWNGISDEDAKMIMKSSFLKVIALGGEAMPTRLISLWGGHEKLILLNVFGLTEFVVYQSRKIISSLSDQYNIGKPYCHVEYKVVSDVLYTNDYPTGDLAEVISGEYLFRGRSNPELNLQRKILGRRIDLSEVNIYLTKTLNFQAAYSVVIDDKVISVVAIPEILKHHVVDENDSKRTIELIYSNLQILSSVIQQAAALDLPRYLIPTNVMFLSHLPTGPTGKINQSEIMRLAKMPLLEQSYESLYRIVESYIDPIECLLKEVIEHSKSKLNPPSTSVEIIISNSWKKEFGDIELFKESNFIVIGGDSMSALRIVRDVRMCLLPDYTSSSDTEALHGDIDGIFAPIELLRRPVLECYSRFIETHIKVECEISDSTSEKNTPNHQFSNLLLDSVRCGCELATNILIKQCNVCPNGGISRLRKGISPLHVASLHGDVNSCSQLLSLGASLYSTTAIGTSALHVAAGAGHSKVVELLINKGTPVSIKDLNKQTCLYYAVRNGHVGLSGELINKYSVPTSNHDRWGRSPVHWAVINNNSSVLRVLLEAGLSLSDTRTKAHKTRLLKEHPIDIALRMHPQESKLLAVLREFST